MKRIIFFLSSITSSPLTCQEIKPTILFDLGGVLIETKSGAAAQRMGRFKTAMYMAYHQTSPRSIKMKLYEVLEKIEPGNCGTRDPDGTLVPTLFCQWQAGTISSAQLRKRVLPAIEKHTDWFVSKLEQEMVLRLAQLLFTPEEFVATRRIVPDGVKFVKDLKDKGYRVAILSNWDRESFNIMKKEYPELFSLFHDNDILLSADVGALKPSDTIYQKAAERFHNPLILIDDQKENLDAAQKHDIYVVWCKKHHSRIGLGNRPDIQDARMQLAQLEKKLNPIPQKLGMKKS